MSRSDARHRLSSSSSQGSARGGSRGGGNSNRWEENRQGGSRRSDRRDDRRDDHREEVTTKGRGSVGATGPLETVTAAHTNTKSLRDLNVNCYLSMDVVNGVEMTTKSSFVRAGCPNLNADERVERCAYRLPRDLHPNTQVHPNTVASCSNKGGICYACSNTGGFHWLGDAPRVLVLADEFFPATGGANKDCLLVWRVEGGSFDHMRALMNAQIGGIGLKLGAGTVVVVSLMTHLFRIGETGYWTELNEFMDWCNHQFKLTVLPAITPYPQDLPWRFISAARRFYARLQWRNFGNSTTRNDPIFSLWKPFMKVAGADELKPMCRLEQFCAEPVTVKNNKNPKEPHYLNCDGIFLIGVGSQRDWEHGMPAALEKRFLGELVMAVKQVQTSPDLVTPDSESIISGLNRETAFKEHQGKRIFIMGASNMSQLQRYILDLARPAGVVVIPLCERGDYLSYFIENPELLDALRNGSTHDLLFFSPLGNRMINYDSKDKKGKAWHFNNPSLITDKQFNELMADLNFALAEIHKVFAGRCILMGPYPRMLRDCCLDNKHWLRDDDQHRIDMLSFTDIFTDHVHRAASLPNNCGFLSYKDIFKHEKFNVSNLVDHVHLDPSAQQLVASHLMQWLDRSSDPIVGKMSEGATLCTLSDALLAYGKIAHANAQQEEEEEVEEIVDEVFDGSAQAYINKARDEKRRKEEEEAAAAQAAANAAAALAGNNIPPSNSSQPSGSGQDAGAPGGGSASMSTSE